MVQRGNRELTEELGFGFSGWTVEWQGRPNTTELKVMQGSISFSRSKLKMEDIKEVNKALKVLYMLWIF